MKRLVVLALLLAATPAAADTIWDRIADEADTPEHIYEQEMQRAEDYLKLAITVSYSERKLLLDKVERAYENAIIARPDAAEPHLRLAELRHELHLVEQRIARGPYGEAILSFDRRIAQDVIEHWEAFEDKAPLDPRITTYVLFDRAIVHTKMGTDEHYEKALADYLTLLDRVRVNDPNTPVYLYNAAETLMMLGRLDEAIPMYERALRASNKTEYVFSLAVALDRDGQGARARDLLAGFVEDDNDLDAIVGKDSPIFFVPTGEIYYYLALGQEVMGNPARAVFFYDKFIRSGAHPRYHERAREHIAQLKAEAP